MRVVVMFKNELKYNHLFLEGLSMPSKYPKAVPFPYTSCMLFMIFTVFVSVGMINLVIGLAIGEVKVAHRFASLRRFSELCTYFTMLEDNKSTSTLLIRKTNLRPLSLTTYPNLAVTGISNFFRNFVSSNVATSSETKPVNAEIQDRVLFQLGVTKRVRKYKKRIKSATSVLQTQSDLVRLLVEKMDLNWEATTTRDEGSKVGKFGKDIKSSKLKSNADWNSEFLPKISSVYV